MSNEGPLRCPASERYSVDFGGVCVGQGSRNAQEMVGRGPKGPSRGGVPGQSVDIVTTKIGSPLMGMSPSIRLLDAKRTGCNMNRTKTWRWRSSGGEDR